MHFIFVNKIDCSWVSGETGLMTLGVSSWALRILDNVNDLHFVWDYRAILQSNNDTHRSGDSGTGIYPYTA